MASWNDLEVTSFSDGATTVALRANVEKAIPGTSMGSSRVVVPNMVLVRSACQGIEGMDWKNQLIGLIAGGVPSVNTLDSLYLCLHKPVIYSKLLEVRKRVGADAFPLVEQTYYSSWKAMSFNTGFPLVCKLGTIHAGFGKVKVNDESAFDDDIRSLVACQSRYVTAEPFIEWSYDFRIQKIGTHIRAFRRYSSHWKGKGMNQRDEDVNPVPPEWISWVELASNALGMDICALDGVFEVKTQKHWLIELNDSACGFIDRHLEEDMQFTKELVLQRAEETVAPQQRLLNPILSNAKLVK